MYRDEAGAGNSSLFFPGVHAYDVLGRSPPATGPWIGFEWHLFWAAVVIGVVYLLRRRQAHVDPGQSGMGALADRYARGEIDEDEYRKRLRVLKER